MPDKGNESRCVHSNKHFEDLLDKILENRKRSNERIDKIIEAQEKIISYLKSKIEKEKKAEKKSENDS